MSKSNDPHWTWSRGIEWLAWILSNRRIGNDVGQILAAVVGLGGVGSVLCQGLLMRRYLSGHPAPCLARTMTDWNSTLNTFNLKGEGTESDRGLASNSHSQMLFENLRAVVVDHHQWSMTCFCKSRFSFVRIVILYKFGM